jgi:D-alanyl-lipoteichoic acid acyltransferase DltB (MBOAT superfamily)
MGVTSISFIFFLFVVIAPYYLFKNFQYVILLIASIYFYFECKQKERLNKYIIITSITIYLATIAISFLRKKLKNKPIKAVFYFTILLNLGFLTYFKYWAFLTENFNAMFHTEFKIKNTIMPMGISFYTFSTIGYLIDIYKNKYPPQKNFLKFLSFIWFFPTISQGPIHKYSDLEQQLFKVKHEFNWEQMCYGLQRILWGLFKKLIIANRLAVFIDPIFNNPTGENAGYVILFAALGFTIRLYMDFSGCMDVVIGAAEMFGIKLVENFQNPYFSKNIREFWQKWHATLNKFFVDYIYIPLGGSKMGEIRKFINIFIIFLISGIWHGANWTFIIWGILHGVAMIVYELWKKTGVILNRFFSWFLTFVFVMFSWIFFNSSSVEKSLLMFKNIFVLNSKNIFVSEIAVLGFISLFVLIAENYGLRKILEKVAKLPIVLRWIIYWTLTYSILLLGIHDENYTKFIYMGF